MKRAWMWAIPALIVVVALFRKEGEPRVPERKSFPATIPVTDGVEVPPIGDPLPSPQNSVPGEPARPTLASLACEGTPEACELLAQAIRDPQDHGQASNAVGALARFPSEAAVNAFWALLRGSEPHLVRLRALQGLLLMIRWTPAEIAVPNQAKMLLISEGLAVAGSIERESEIAAFRHEAREVREEINFLMRVRE